MGICTCLEKKPDWSTVPFVTQQIPDGTKAHVLQVLDGHSMMIGYKLRGHYFRSYITLQGCYTPILHSYDSESDWNQESAKLIRQIVCHWVKTYENQIRISSSSSSVGEYQVLLGHSSKGSIHLNEWLRQQGMCKTKKEDQWTQGELLHLFTFWSVRWSIFCSGK